MPGWNTSLLHDRWQDDYERGRPGWPVEAVEVVRLDPGATVVDLGAGTGKLTRLLVPRYAQVIAIEPDEGMRRVLTAVCDGIDGTAEHLPLADASVEAVFAAEAFHRFEGERSVTEIARVLRPGGTLALLWNVPGGDDHDDVAAAVDLMRSRAPEGLAYDAADLNTTRYSSGAWRDAFEGSAFGALEEAAILHEQIVDRDGLLAFFSSMGWLAELLALERSTVLADVRALLTEETYVRSWRTHIHWARLAG